MSGSVSIKRKQSKLNSGEVVDLRLWCMQFAKRSFGIYLVGYRSADDSDSKLIHWHTQAVQTRLNPNLLVTANGSRYRLIDQIDKEYARSIGFPNKLFELFANGFPRNWDSILEAFYNKVTSTNCLNATNWFDNVYMKNHPTSANTSKIGDSSQRCSEDNAKQTNVNCVDRSRRVNRMSLLPPMTTETIVEEQEEDSCISVTEKSSAHEVSVAASDIQSTPLAPPMDKNRRKSVRINLPSPVAVTPQKKKEDKAKDFLIEMTPGILPLARRDGTPAGRTRGRLSIATPGTFFGKDSQRTRVNKEDIPLAVPVDEAHDIVEASKEVVKSAVRTVLTPLRTTGNTNIAKNSTESSIIGTPNEPEKQTTKTLPEHLPNDTPILQENQRVLRTRTPKPSPSPRSAKKTPSSATKAQKTSNSTIKEKLACNVQEPAEQICCVDVQETPKCSQKSHEESINNEVVHNAVPEAPVAASLEWSNMPEQVSIVKKNNLELSVRSPMTVGNVDGNSFKVPQKPAKRRTTALVPVLSKSIEEIATTAVGLSQWMIVFTNPPKKITLGHPPFRLLGLKDGAEWSTSVIVHVVLDRFFVTTSGGSYSLLGEISAEKSRKACFPVEFIEKFRYGFPSNWKSEMDQVYRVHLSGNEHLEESMIGMTSHCLQNSVLARQDTGIVEFPDDSGENRVEFGSQNVLNNTSIMSNGKSKVRVSSRGRAIMSPLDHRAGQRVVYGTHGQVVRVENGNGAMYEVAEHFGFSPSAPRENTSTLNNRVERYGPCLAVERGGRKTTHRRQLVQYSDSDSECDDTLSARRRRDTQNRTSTADSPLWRQPAKRRKIDSDSGSSEEELRVMRKVLKRKRKKLERKQRQLELVEREHARTEALWRKTKKLEANRHRFEYEQPRARERHQSKMSKKQKLRKISQKSKKSMGTSQYSDDELRRQIELLHEQEKEAVGSSSSSTETDVSDGGDWRAPIKKKTQNGSSRHRQRFEEKSESEESSDECSEESDADEDMVEDAVRRKSKGKESRPKKVIWRKNDVDRLKLAITATAVVTENDWEKVSRSLGGKFSAEDCMKAAVTRLKWKPPLATENTAVLDEVEQISARPGTSAFQIQAQNFTRKYMMGAGTQEDDCFKKTDSAEFEDGDLELEADCSILEALQTPVVTKGTKGGRRAAFVPEGVEDTPTPGHAHCRSDRRSTIVPLDSTKRENQTRYVHQLISHNKSGMHNVSSRMNASMAYNGYMNAKKRKKQLNDIENDLVDVNRKVKGAQREHGSSEENSDGDLEPMVYSSHSD